MSVRVLNPVKPPLRFLVALLAAVLAVGALSAPADAATKRSLSIKASPSAAVVGKTVTFSGTLTKSPKGTKVTIQRKVGTKWVAAKTAKTSTSAGRYAGKVILPRKAGTYAFRAVAAKKGSLSAATSKTLKVAALTGVTATIKASPTTVTAGATSTVSGAVKPFVKNTTVVIQKFVNGKWLGTGATAKLSSKGTYSKAVVTKDTSVYRVFVPRVGLKSSAVSVGTAVIANPVIATTSLPNGSQGAPYSATVKQVGTAAGTWSVTPALPNGLTLNTTSGAITGTPTAATPQAAYTFRFAQPARVTASKAINLTITAPVPPTIATSSLPEGDQGVGYTTTLTAQGNPGGTWTAAPLPAGLTLNAGTGVISGTPTASGTTNVNIGFTQTSTGLAAPGKQLALTINPPPAPSIRTVTLPNASQFAAYSFTLKASEPGGVWNVQSGKPVGIDIDAATGVLSGTSAIAGTYTTVITYAVPSKPVASATYVWKVVATGFPATRAAVEAGGSSTCRINQDRTLDCWGYDDAGQLGDGGVLTVDPAGVSAPTQVGTATDWTAISVSDDDLPTEGHACGLRGDDAYCWGSNKKGMLGNGVANGSETAPVAVAGGRDWQSISAGWTHTCGVTTAGELYCWGENTFGQLGTGGGDASSPTRVGSASDWESVSAGYTTTCAVKATGGLFCWGMGSRGQLGTGNTDSQATPAKVGTAAWTGVQVGPGHACGRQVDGTLWCWGTAANGQLGNNVSLNDTSTDERSPRKVGTATTWVSFATGKGHTCATNTAGELWCWGANGESQLGDNSVTNRLVPTKIGSGTDWISVSAGATHSAAAQENGDTYVWGSNYKSKANAGAGTARVAVPTKVVG
ncbi:alpha-tubulin suppressor-like RCC1 family protein [Marmoricola sp. OAE513]|uniref:putative Ig domain-containing protein n=1 Tax=Marmoricola sp. OAE513 TaxID=2817894 RepID=UPI001AE337D8